MKQIPLTKSKFALVDNENFDWLNQWKWSTNSKGYAMRTTYNKNTPKKHQIYMHRLILNTPPKLLTDHKDRNKLNNQRNNLRIATATENRQNSKNNTSKYKEITHDKTNKKWKAQITHNKKYIYLGRFNTQEKAALAYNKAAIKYHNKFAKLNTIQ